MRNEIILTSKIADVIHWETKSEGYSSFAIILLILPNFMSENKEEEKKWRMWFSTQQTYRRMEKYIFYRKEMNFDGALDGVH